MALTLANLYCSPQDVYDAVGVDAAQLRLDDRNQASGQNVLVWVAAPVNATSLTITAIQYPMLAGTRLVFGEAGMNPPVEVTLAVSAPVGALSLTVAPIGTAIAAGAQATDNGVNVWLGSLLLKACRYATTQVKLYCTNRYDDSDLANNASENGSVNRWATALATRWLAKRRYQAAPIGIEEDYRDAMEELRQVKAGQLCIEDIGTRTSGWPFMSNITLIDTYSFTKARVETITSEPTPTQYPQFVDWNGIVGVFEW
jgi:hypothetical protein